MRHVQHETADLVCAKWLRAHGAAWPEQLGFSYTDGGEHDEDWPYVAVVWCRSEGCTAPLLSDIADDEFDGNDSDSHQDPNDHDRYGDAE